MARKARVTSDAPKAPKPTMTVLASKLGGKVTRVGNQVTVKVTGKVTEEKIGEDWEEHKGKRLFRMEVGKVSRMKAKKK